MTAARAVSTQAEARSITRSRSAGRTRRAPAPAITHATSSHRSHSDGAPRRRRRRGRRGPQRRRAGVRPARAVAGPGHPLRPARRRPPRRTRPRLHRPLAQDEGRHAPGQATSSRGRPSRSLIPCGTLAGCFPSGWSASAAGTCRAPEASGTRAGTGGAATTPEVTGEEERRGRGDVDRLCAAQAGCRHDCCSESRHDGCRI